MNYKDQTGLTIEEAFEKHLQENPEAYATFVTYTLRALNGRKKILRAKSIVSQIRDDNTYRHRNEKIGINDAFISSYTRLFVKQHPEYDGVFAMRRTRSVPEQKPGKITDVVITYKQVDFYYPDLEDDEEGH